MNPSAVLHVLSPLGGGVDRYVRDIAATVARPQLVWHVGRVAEVLETPGVGRRYLPLDPVRVDAQPELLEQLLRSKGVRLVHLHAVHDAPRERARQMAQRLGVPLMVTLHDVLFLRPDAFDSGAPTADRAWTEKIAPVLSSACAVLAPSRYLARLANDTFPSLDVQVVPNGLETFDENRGRTLLFHDSGKAGCVPGFPRPEFLANKPRRVVAVLGAIGAHKGADLLRQLPAHLEGSGIGVVVIGYLDQQVYPGWNPKPHLYVHGPYHPLQTGQLLRAYGAELVLFPNRVPESFSYSLSEAWAAGVPVVAGAAGAIGERIARHGGGWLLPEGFDAAQVAAQLRRLLGPDGAGEVARVRLGLSQPDTNRVPTLAAMAESLEAYYRRYGREAATPGAMDAASVDALLAPSLDSSLFRQELAFLADLCDQSDSHARRQRDFEAEARRWIGKLEGDVASLQAELKREFDERQRIAVELGLAQTAAGAAIHLPHFVNRVLGRLLRRARS